MTNPIHSTIEKLQHALAEALGVPLCDVTRIYEEAPVGEIGYSAACRGWKVTLDVDLGGDTYPPTMFRISWASRKKDRVTSRCGGAGWAWSSAVWSCAVRPCDHVDAALIRRGMDAVRAELETLKKDLP